jgi:PAS domain-containing protein
LICVNFHSPREGELAPVRILMATAFSNPEDIVIVALEAARRGESEMAAALDRLPAPVYVTDAEGRITYFNAACIDFAGRTPVVGEDNWCVTWKLFSKDGEFLPHDRCPMAVAIQEKRAVRGASAVAERPDGTRVPFIPFPTPLLDEAGEVVGAVNLLIDTTDGERVRHLREQALRCRRLSRSVSDPQVTRTLELMGAEYEQQASTLSRMN